MKKKTVFLSALACVCALGLSAKVPPWKMIYSNDTTNILNCTSPFNQRGDRVFTEEKIRGSVREAAVPGMGAQLLQPGTAWVPWWRSKLVPLEEHEQWFREHFGVEPNSPEHRYLLGGGDMVEVFTDECQKNGNDALVSFRANDSHLQERSWGEPKPPGGWVHCVSRFYVEHPQYRQKPLPANDWRDRNHSWAFPEARAYKEALLVELIENYPKLAGVEVDFLRHPYFFPDTMPMDERVSIMVDFLKKARAALDKLEKQDGKYRYLGTRVSAKPHEWKDTGFDPKAWYDAGVDFFNLSTHYCSEQTSHGILLARQQALEAGIYSEITHTTMTWRMGGKGYDDHQYRRTTKEAMHALANLAYARGADGISLFNFAYYRPHGGYLEHKAPFTEPLFENLPPLADKGALEKMAPAYYFSWQRDNHFPARKKTAEFKIDMIPAKGNGEALLRLLVLTQEERMNSEREPLKKIDRGQWTVKLNGQVLEPTQGPDVAYPYPSTIKSGFNNARQYLSFEIPAGTIKDGANDISVTNTKVPQPMNLRWLEVIQP